MLYKLSHYEATNLQIACEVAQCQAAENAEASKRCAKDQHLPKAERDSAARVAMWYLERAATFETVCKALDYDRGITTLAQAKEALER